MKRCIIIVQILINIILICSIQKANAQIRINELDLRTDNSEELKEIIKDQQESIRTLQLQLNDLQNQFQILKGEMEVLAVEHQNEKINSANNISLVFTELQKLKTHLTTEFQESESRIIYEIENRFDPFDQVFEISGGTLFIRSSVIDMQASSVLFEKVIKGTTIIVENVISATYTPGAGNIW